MTMLLYVDIKPTNLSFVICLWLVDCCMPYFFWFNEKVNYKRQTLTIDKMIE